MRLYAYAILFEETISNPLTPSTCNRKGLFCHYMFLCAPAQNLEPGMVKIYWKLWASSWSSKSLKGLRGKQLVLAWFIRDPYFVSEYSHLPNVLQSSLALFALSRDWIFTISFFCKRMNSHDLPESHLCHYFRILNYLRTGSI